MSYITVKEWKDFVKLIHTLLLEHPEGSFDQTLAFLLGRGDKLGSNCEGLLIDKNKQKYGISVQNCSNNI